MSFLAVYIPAPREEVERAEREASSVSASFGAWATSDGPRPYRRFHRPGEVLDLLAFEGDDHESFVSRATAVARTYEQALGVEPECKFWHSTWHSLGSDVGQFPVARPGTEGSVMITIHYSTIGLDTVEEVEEQRPDLMEGFVKALRGNGLITHSRYFGDGEVLDLDEFATEAGYWAFMREAEHLIDEYNALSGDDTGGVLWYSS